MELGPTDPYLDIPPPRPSRALGAAMVVVGILFLLPFTLLVVSGAAPLSLSAFLDALLTVGWTVFLGVVFLVFGLRKLKEARAANPAGRFRRTS